MGQEFEGISIGTLNVRLGRKECMGLYCDVWFVANWLAMEHPARSFLSCRDRKRDGDSGPNLDQRLSDMPVLAQGTFSPLNITKSTTAPKSPSTHLSQKEYLLIASQRTCWKRTVSAIFLIELPHLAISSNGFPPGCTIMDRKGFEMYH